MVALAPDYRLLGQVRIDDYGDWSVGAMAICVGCWSTAPIVEQT
jgi:hypothetical protein